MLTPWLTTGGAKILTRTTGKLGDICLRGTSETVLSVRPPHLNMRAQCQSVLRAYPDVRMYTRTPRADMYTVLALSVLSSVLIYLAFILEDVANLEYGRLSSWWRLFQWYIHGSLGLFAVGTILFGYCNCLVMRIIYTDHQTTVNYDSTDYSTWYNVQAGQWLILIIIGVIGATLFLLNMSWKYATKQARALENDSARAKAQEKQKEGEAARAKRVASASETEAIEQRFPTPAAV